MKIAGLMTAINDVIAERQRQVRDEGWSPEHDDGHTSSELSRAAACYALNDCFPVRRENPPGRPPRRWPWDRSWWKPKDRRRDLVRAAALIIAEIERLDRAAKKSA